LASITTQFVHVIAGTEQSIEDAAEIRWSGATLRQPEQSSTRKAPPRSVPDRYGGEYVKGGVGCGPAAKGLRHDCYWSNLPLLVRIVYRYIRQRVVC
jgi:hypothetical protein